MVFIQSVQLLDSATSVKFLYNLTEYHFTLTRQTDTFFGSKYTHCKLTTTWEGGPLGRHASAGAGS